MAISETVMENLDIGAEAPAATPKKYRVQLDFTAEDFQELNELTSKLGLPTRAELFRSALITLRWMYKKRLQGYTIAAVSPERRFLAEPEFPFLERVTPDRAFAATETEIAAAFGEVTSFPKSQPRGPGAEANIAATLDEVTVI